MKNTEMALWIVSLIIVSPFLLFFLPQAIGAHDAYIVRSGSMAPSIPTGSIIFVKSPDFSQIENGDVVTFRHSSSPGPGEISLTTHRVIDIRERNGTYSFKTKGDANEDPDPGYIPEESLEGVNMFSIPYIGFAMAWMKTFEGYLTMILIPTTLLVVNQLKEIFSETGIAEKIEAEKLFPAVTLAAVIAVVTTALLAVRYMNLNAPPVSYNQLMIGAIMILLGTIIYLQFKE